MGPGLAFAVLGAKAAAPTALIFCCDAIFLFTIVPLLIALTDGKPRHWLHTMGLVVRQIVFQSADHVGGRRGIGGGTPFSSAGSDRQYAIVFAKRRGADGAVRARRNGRAAPVRSRPLGSARCDRGKTPDPSTRRVRIDVAAGAIPAALGGYRNPDGLAAPALNVFVMARQHDSWIQPASVAVLIGKFASVITLTSVMWLIQTGRLVFP
jgi:malonate transporter